MNPEGKDGPTLKSMFTCEHCKFISKSVLGKYGHYPYKCLHEDILIHNKTSFQLMNGDIGPEKITPIFCPFLMKKMRFEKLNQINSNESK